MPNSRMSHALNGAKIVGCHGQNGTMCAWFGGYSFNVYDVTSWEEVRHFTSGELAEVSDRESERAYELAKKRMRNEGFTVIE